MAKTSTIRDQLTQCEFDWKNGVIIYHPWVVDEDGYPQRYEDLNRPPAYVVDHADPLLDQPFLTGYGARDCPDVIALDELGACVVWQYDGASGIQRVRTDVSHYLGGGAIPVLGG